MLPFCCGRQLVVLFLVHTPVYAHLMLRRNARQYDSLTNRFHVAVHLSFNRSQMTSKCGKNKKVAHEAIAECVTDVLTTF